MDLTINAAGGLGSWAEEDLRTVQFGDVRLAKRATLMVRRMVDKPGASIHESCKDQAEHDGASRLLASEKCKPHLVCEAMRRATWQRVRAQGVTTVLLIQDTTSVNFSSHKATKGLGPLGGGDGSKGRGFLCHTCFAATTDGLPIGIVGQKRWARDPEAVGSRHERRDRAQSDKESARWGELEAQVNRALPSDLHAITVCDREADIVTFLAQQRPANSNILVRAAQDRALTQKGKKLFGTMRHEPVRDSTIIAVRQHPEHEPRWAYLTLQYRPVTLKGLTYGPAEDRCGPVTLTAIRVAEPKPKEGCKRIEWVLLTDLPVQSVHDAWQCVTHYTHRWLIERYHFTLKSGCKLERSQLRTRDRLERALVLHSVVAWRLLWLTYLARIDPELPATSALSELEVLAAWLLTHEDGTLPPPDLTISQAMALIAKAGGHKPRKSDYSPGVLSIIAGLAKLCAASIVIGRFIGALMRSA